MRALRALPGRIAAGCRAGREALRRHGAGARSGQLSNPAVTPEVFRERIAGSFPGDLGLEVVRIEDDEVEGHLTVDGRHLHPGGYVHGGVWVALADTVAAWGTFRHLPAGHNFTTVELKINVFASATDGDVLRAVGRPAHVGRRTHVWQVTVANGERDAALFVCTQMVLAPS